jgi:hypothetical protein
LKCENSHFITLKVVIYAFLFLILISDDEVFSQTVTLTSPMIYQELPVGDDYFTDVISQPADGSQKRMIGWEDHLENKHFSNEGGIWKGYKENLPFNLFPIFPSIKGALLADSLPGDKTLPKFGTRYPVNAEKYFRLSYLMTVENRSLATIYFNNDWNDVAWWPTLSTPRLSVSDSFRNEVTNFAWRTYDLDLKERTKFHLEEKRWQGNVYGIRIDPSISSMGGSIEIDWVRLVDPDSAPWLTINWNTDAPLNGTYFYSLKYEKKDSSNQGGSLIQDEIFRNSFSYVFPSAILPPGEYRFYVELYKRNSALNPDRSFTPAAISNYSSDVVIHKKPEVVITAPAPDSGESYARKIRGREWDMRPDGGDVRNLQLPWTQIWRQFLYPFFSPNDNSQLSGSVFQALAEPPYFHIGNAESDVQVHLDISQREPIDPSYFRYFVYRMAIGEDGYPDLHSKISKGWVSRVVGWNNDVTKDAIETRAHLVYDGWNTYWFDLADDENRESGQPWTSFKEIRNLRLDPGEFNIPDHHTWFFLDYVKLHAENRAFNDTYEIRFSLKRGTRNLQSVEVYFDEDNKDFNGTLITQMEGLGEGDHAYVWDTSSLPKNRNYYIYIVVSDGLQQAKTYSSVHIKTSSEGASRLPKKKNFGWDYSGDGADDYMVYRPGTGTWFNKLSRGDIQTLPFGNHTHFPIRGDFDGDGIIDKGLITQSGGVYFYYILLSSNGQVHAQSWGRVGDFFAIADYNGNGRDQIAVWRPEDGNWYILDELGRAFVYQWGLPGDIPVPADFTGDGTINLAVWRPSTGMWWVRHQTDSDFSFSGQQWGLPGDIPVAGWIGEDGVSKHTVWRPSNGTWYVYDGVTKGVTIQQWGFPGDIPIVGDHNQDGITDFSVFRNGFWFHNFRNGQTGMTGWGLPGDRVPMKVGTY